MKCMAGIDIGTTNIKGAVYDEAGRILAAAKRGYESHTPAQNFHEQEPGDWVKGLVQVLEEMVARKNIRANLSAISLSTQGGTVVPVDREGRPVCRAVTWLDRRGLDLLDQHKRLRSENLKFYDRTGWRLDSGMSFLPLYWLQEQKRDVFAKIYRIMWVNDYVQKEICGNFCQDPSNASISLFYHVARGEWDQDIMDLLGLDPSYFSEVSNPGQVVGFLKDEYTRKLGLGSKVAVINGAHDQYCAAVAAGTLFSRDILLATGTAWVMFKAADDPLLDREGFFALGRFSKRQAGMPDKFGLIYSIPSAGASIKWFARNVMALEKEEELFARMASNPEKMDRKSKILFYPYLSGAPGPDFAPGKKASFVHLELGHDCLDMVKAMMEGAGFQLNRIMGLLAQKGIGAQNLMMIGGGAKNRFWPQIIADITEKKVLIPYQQDQDLACRGAAVIAGYGSGVFSSLDEGFRRLASDYKAIQPQTSNLAFYKEKYQQYLRFNRRL